MKTSNAFDGSPAWESQSRAACDTFQGETGITRYLRDISRTELLTPQEEIELAGRIKKGDPEARDQMIKSNLRLVVKIARAYEGIGMPLLDLISEGNIGLMRAVDRFDPRKGAKLSSYGALWIKHAITQALASQSKAIRLPTYVADMVGKMRRTASRLEDELGREPTDEELAEECGTTSRRVTQMRMAAIRPASLDAQINGEDTGSYADIIPDENVESPHVKLDRKIRVAMVRQVVQTLSERERFIVRLRFGLDGEKPKTLDEIGEELGLSSERVRQLQNTALKKVRCRITHFEIGSHSPGRVRSRNHCKSMK